MNKTKTYEYAAKEFLQSYVKENGIKDICELFDKETLVEFVYQSDWDWAIKDEMEINGLSEEDAQIEAEYWFLSMSKYELFYNRIALGNRDILISDKAEDLGFEWKE
jgi:hypothetical protein